MFDEEHDQAGDDEEAEGSDDGGPVDDGVVVDLWKKPTIIDGLIN